MFRGETGETTYAVRRTFLSRFCAIQWRSSHHDGRETHTRLICGTGWRLSDIYDCRSRNRNTARPFSAFNCIEKSPGSRKSISNERRNGKKEGKKAIGGAVVETPLETESRIVFFFFFFFAHGVSIIDN